MLHKIRTTIVMAIAFTGEQDPLCLPFTHHQAPKILVLVCVRL